MADIGGIPYAEVEFDENGKRKNNVSVPDGTTDLFMISHGWNNDHPEARELYNELFGNVAGLMKQFDLAGRKCAIVGVLWPSKKFNTDVASDGGTGTNAAAIGGSKGQGQKEVDKALQDLKKLFKGPKQKKAIEDARALLPKLQNEATARRQFVAKMRSLLDPKAANDEDASTTFFKSQDDDELMKRLQIDPDDLDPEVSQGGGAAAMPGKSAKGSKGGAAGLGSFFSGFMTSAMNLLNFTTYYEMKSRAGAVGKNGVAPLLDELAEEVGRIHLIGHSFGGRVVTAAAANSKTGIIKSMTLLQAAFSHNGFSKSKKGFFRRVVDGKRVSGPILITHTKNDRAVGLAYPIASRLNGDKTAAFGDENDEYGGIGRNGAQKMAAGEVDGQERTLREAGGKYKFVSGCFFNLKADAFISGHSDVRGKQVAHAILCAVTAAK